MIKAVVEINFIRRLNFTWENSGNALQIFWLFPAHLSLRPSGDEIDSLEPHSWESSPNSFIDKLLRCICRCLLRPGHIGAIHDANGIMSLDTEGFIGLYEAPTK